VAPRQAAGKKQCQGRGLTSRLFRGCRSGAGYMERYRSPNTAEVDAGWQLGYSDRVEVVDLLWLNNLENIENPVDYMRA
jgi:hypothetical protein